MSNTEPIKVNQLLDIKLINNLAYEAYVEGKPPSYKKIRKVVIDATHRQLTDSFIPRTVNGNRLGLKKRLNICNLFKDLDSCVATGV